MVSTLRKQRLVIVVLTVLLAVGLAVLLIYETYSRRTDEGYPLEATQPANLTIYEDGILIAIAWVDLPDELPASGETMSGRYELIRADEPFPKEAMSTGIYNATIRDDDIFFDLNVRYADNNVLLVGTIRETQISGQWEHATDAGSAPRGDFELRR